MRCLERSDDLYVFFVGDVATAHGAEMGRLKLAVDYPSAIPYYLLCQEYQRQL